MGTHGLLKHKPNGAGIWNNIYFCSVMNECQVDREIHQIKVHKERALYSAAEVIEHNLRILVSMLSAQCAEPVAINDYGMVKLYLTIYPNYHLGDA